MSIMGNDNSKLSECAKITVVLNFNGTVAATPNSWKLQSKPDGKPAKVSANFAAFMQGILCGETCA
eukprot:1587392-Amphidinium_carterae.1